MSFLFEPDFPFYPETPKPETNYNFLSSWSVVTEGSYACLYGICDFLPAKTLV